MRYDISVITPVYNGSAFLIDCIESVRKELNINIEHIIIDDGSKDNSFDIANSYNDVVTLKQENLGAPSARNLGLKNARGKYIKFLDADDVLIKGSLEKQFRLTEASPKNSLLIFYGYRDIIWEQRKIMSRRVFKGAFNRECIDCCVNQEIAHRITKNIVTSLPLYPVSALKKVGGFDPKLKSSQEWNLNIRLAAEGFTFRYDDIHCYTQRIHDSPTRISNRKLIPKEEIDNDLITYDFIKEFIYDKRVKNAWSLRLWSQAEVLAASGHKDEAEYLFREATKIYPKSELIKEFGSAYRFLVSFVGAENTILLKEKVRRIARIALYWKL